MLQLSLQWHNFQRRWRVFRRLGQHSTVPWLLFTLICLESSVVTASSYHPAIVHPPPQYSHHPPPHPSPRSYPPPHHMGAQNPQPSILTGPSQMPNPNLYYTIDQGNKLVQRQMPPGPGGITAAATNYLLQQLQNEQLQQQRSIVAPPRPHPQPQAAPVASASAQQQTLQMLANLTPQQIVALQSVLPSLSRSNNQMSPQPVGIPVPVSAGAQTVHQHQGDSPNGVNPQLQFASRMGPFDKIFNRAKSWLHESGSAHSKSDHTGNGIGEPKMRDLHRLPKPPKYPLYDLPGLATPPPAPIMHPMSSLPNSAFDLDQPQMAPPMQTSSPRSPIGGSMVGSSSGYNQQNWMSPSPTMSTSRRSRPAPPRTPRPSKPSFLRNPLRSHKKPRPSMDTPLNYNRRNHGPPPSGRQPPRTRTRGPHPSLPSLTKPPPKKNGPHRGRFPSSVRRPPASSSPNSDPYASSSSGGSMGFDHPMASNLSPAQSPALGRPLSYEEYMARPSHSYTNDPWNFDPFASQMNQGLNTHALRYNYDPLGMNALDTEANSHLDPNKLSYPGDSFNQDMVKDAPGIGSTGQMGGWDKPYKKRPFGSDPDTDLTPPGQSPGYEQSGNSQFSSSPSDPYNPPSSMGSSSNRYKNSGSSGTSYQSNSGNMGSGFLGDALNGGRRGEMGSSPNDPFEGGSGLPSFNLDDHRNNHDGAPTIDLESLSPQQDDDGGLEFTIETSMDKGSNGGFGMEESSQPNPHPLGPMQPAPNPFLSDQYSPYGEQSSPQESSIPGIPYGPNGYNDQDDRREQRYGRRRTRNNSQRSQQGSQRRSLRIKPQTQFQQQQQLQQPQQQQRSQSPVPEGVQIFNEIIRPELEKLQTPNNRQLSNQNRAQLRKQIYSAIRQSDGK